MRVLTAILFIICLGRSFSSLGQDRYFKSKEIGLTVGGAYYLGELNQAHYKNVKLGLGGYFKFNFNRRVSFAINLLHTNIEGADSTSNVAWRKNRNLHFKNAITELSGMLEINYTDYQIGNEVYYFTPYLYVGMGAFYSNPKAYNGDDWIELRKIGTEGQYYNGVKLYNLVNFVIPFGVGIKVNLGTSGIALALHAGFRKTFTDYIDDVGGIYADPTLFEPEEAQFVDRSLDPARADGTNTGLDRGNTNTKDWYQFTGITLSFKVNRKKNTCEWYR